MTYDNSTTRNTITGYFSSRSDAEQAVEDLRDAGFTQSQISLALRPNYGKGNASSAVSTGNSVAAKGESVWNKVVNFFEGKSADDGNVAQTERASSGYDYDYDATEFEGSLNKMNLPESQSRYFNHQFSQGDEGAIITVSASGREEEVVTILEDANGDIGRNAATYEYPAEPSTKGTEAQRIQLFGEMLRVHKERIQSGEVVLRKEVITEMQTIEVPVTREELILERRPVAGGTPASGKIGDNAVIRIPLSEERASVDKETVLREEVLVGKKTVAGTQSVGGEVRHEELDIKDKVVNK